MPVLPDVIDLSTHVRVSSFDPQREQMPVEWTRSVASFCLVRFMEMSMYYRSFEEFVAIIAYGYEMTELECMALMTLVAPYQAHMGLMVA